MAGITEAILKTAANTGLGGQEQVPIPLVLKIKH